MVTVSAGFEKQVQGLRTRAETDPDGARAAAYALVHRLGRANDIDALNALYRLGTVPEGLRGWHLTEPVSWTYFSRGVNGFMNAVTRLVVWRLGWIPSAGKTFDPDSKRGVNMLTNSAAVMAKVVFPFYRFSKIGDMGRRGFEFETYVGPGWIDPDLDVLAIDFKGDKDNPRIVTATTRDECVEIVPGVNLGRAVTSLFGKQRCIMIWSTRLPVVDTHGA